MKRKIAAVAAVVLAVTPLTGCKKERINSKATADTVSDKDRAEETCQEALENMFKAQYSFNGAENYYSYTFPQILLNQLKINGTYDEKITIFNDAQRIFVENMSQMPEITEFTGQDELTDSQLEAASAYFVNIAETELLLGLDPRGINITEGYQLHYNFIDYNGNADTDDNECVVYIENDGWKVIPMSAERLREKYSNG